MCCQIPFLLLQVAFSLPSQWERTSMWQWWILSKRSMGMSLQVHWSFLHWLQTCCGWHAHLSAWVSYFTLYKRSGNITCTHIIVQPIEYMVKKRKNSRILIVDAFLANSLNAVNNSEEGSRWRKQCYKKTANKSCQSTANFVNSRWLVTSSPAVNVA